MRASAAAQDVKDRPKLIRTLIASLNRAGTHFSGVSCAFTLSCSAGRLALTQHLLRGVHTTPLLSWAPEYG